jgi:hypothetical protein
MKRGPRGGKVAESVRQYSGGVRARDLPGEWRRDWKHSYAILTRDHDDEELPSSWFGRQWYRIKAFFLELSYRLSPARRLLLLLCLIFAFLGMQTDSVGPIADEIEIWQHPQLMLLAIVGLVFLLIFELADRVQVRDELEVARQLQSDLLPQAGPAVEGYEFAFSYRSANTVGGDYYDFLELEDGRLAIAVGDASGHGMAAAMLMAISNSTVRLASDIDPEPRAVARLVNRALVGSGGPRSFLTLFYALLEPVTGRLDFVCAGHPFPLLRRSGGEIVPLGTGSFPLGLRPDVELSSGSEVLLPGDLLLLFTDGIPEALGEGGESFGFDRVQTNFEPGGSAREVHDRILGDLDRFLGRKPLVDDRSLVVISRAPGVHGERIEEGGRA